MHPPPHTNDDDRPIVLVTPEDQAIGTCGKLHAHQAGLTHRAFSVLVLRESHDGWQVLMQQRQHSKYHCPGLWSNTCCSHPEPGETVIASARRRLNFEMGLDLPLKHLGYLHYRHTCPPDLIEDEVDHILIAHDHHQVSPQPNPQEVADWRWQNCTNLQEQLQEQATASHYTPWLKHVISFTLSNIK